MLKSYFLHIDQVIQESPDAISIHFKQPPIDRIWYKAGQYLTLKIELNGEQYLRSYSICTAPRLDSSLAITVKRVKGGIISNYLNDQAKAGMALESSRPFGRFIIENSVKAQRHICLFAAGSGITPIFSILRSTLYNEPNSQISLFYANRTEADIIFLAALVDMQKKFSSRFYLHHILSQPQANTSIQHDPGRLNADQIGTLLQKSPFFPSSMEYLSFVCGPEGFMQEVQKGLVMNQIPKERIRVESFTIDSKEQAAHIPQGGSAHDVILQIGAQSHQFRVPAGSSILDAGLFQGIDIPYSCKAGTCASCMGHIKKGQVQMARNDALLDFEVAQGKVLVCQAHPTDDQVEIEMGWY